MKIKSDFVTNSSSTSYLVFIPDNFDYEIVNRVIDASHTIQKDIEELNEWTERKGKDCKKEIEDAFKDLVNGKSVYHYDCDSFYTIHEILHELGLVVSVKELSGSQDGHIINLNSKDIKSKLETIRSGGWGLKYGGWGHETKG